MEAKIKDLSTIPDIAENLPCCFYVAQAEPPYQLLYANAEMLRLFDCRDFDELWNHIQGNVWNVVALDDRERVKQEIRHEMMKEDDRFSHVRGHLFTRTSRIRYADISGQPVETEAYGKVYYCTLQEIDIPKPGETVDRDVRDYVINHLDEAIENHWIQVYYQPVIRTLTGEVCGMEALARWVDPQLGFLSPASFIPVLEQVRLIHRLDAFVLDEVCHMLSQRLRHDLPITPVSFNLSRYDFDMLDVFSLIETARTAYDLPRDFLHVEITESALARNASTVHQALDRLRSKGYEVWLDDFGSDYSSLNILKDYTFDLIKLDMEFLRSFTETSRCIIRSVVAMAKDLGIKTLAEGVETREHAEFLAAIGCGRQQGYYYGKPCPLAGTLAHIEAEGRRMEPRKWCHYYDAASMVIRQTDRTSALFDSQEDGRLRFLYANQPYQEQIQALGYHLQDITENLSNSSYPLSQTFRNFVNRSRETKQTESFCYIDGGDYVNVHVRVVCEMNHHHLIHVEFENISQSATGLQLEKLDDRLRYLYNMFDEVYLIDFRSDTIAPLSFHTDDKQAFPQEIAHGIRQALQQFASQSIYPDDREGYLAFCDPSTVMARIRQSPDGRISHSFRTRNQQGNYVWRECTAVLLDSGQTPLMLTASRRIDIPHAAPAAPDSRLVLPALLWQNFQEYTPFCYFWKDTDRRFLGATKAFLRHYGLSSQADLIGKTDEDMNWHTDGESYRQDELAVLHEGRTIENVAGECIVKGIPHRITCYKRPLYRDGQIIGLVGFFLDADEIYRKVYQSLPSPYIDPDTELYNRPGFLGELIRYQEKYRQNHCAYALILLERHRIVQQQNTYEAPVRQSLVREEARILRQMAGQDSTIARIQAETFAVLHQEDDPAASYRRAQDLRRSLEAIHEIDGNPVTITFHCSIVHNTEPSLRQHPDRKGNRVSSIYRLAMERLRHAKR
ncbi:EAL domain-containing protein [uncultured Megasphaera sp.]|uniref:EAL domain-containing protein n=1 Tax=uncultured Megasphaera sp. TaxID=165188 RepID=UPI0026075E90|nr:EAL domain-containing protein [uncultured Megasphaera sp.]